MESFREWSLRMHGARFCILQLKELYNKEHKKTQRLFNKDKVIDDAIYKLVMSDLKNLDKFLNEEDVYLRNHKYNDKGKIIEVEAYFKR